MPDAEPLRSLLATATAPELGPGPRPGVLALGALQARIEEALARVPRPAGAAQALRALILLWHDHHEPAHELVQDGATTDASYVHGILHRREPDYGNARYWFHRVGRHAAFGELGRRVQPLLKSDTALQSRLLPRGQWDAFAFIDACAGVEQGGEAGDVDLLREVQRIEFEVLLERLCGVE